MSLVALAFGESFFLETTSTDRRRITNISWGAEVSTEGQVRVRIEWATLITL